jgi:hypothetical protein
LQNLIQNFYVNENPKHLDIAKSSLLVWSLSQFMYLNQFPELWNSMENHVAQMLDETPAL